MEEVGEKLDALVAGYGNPDISRLYAEQKIANSNIKTSEKIAIICRALISATQNIKPENVFEQLDKDTFVLQLQTLEATALKSINILSNPKVSEEVPVVKVEKIESEQALNVAATFWGAVTSIATTLVEAASPPMERRPPPPSESPSPQVSPRQKTVQSASMEKWSEEKTVVSKEIFSKEIKVTPPQKPKKAKKKSKSKLVTIENPKSHEEIEAERTATQEQSRLAQEKSVMEVEQIKASLENTQAEIKKISEQLVEYEAKPLGGATRQTLKELQRSVNTFVIEIPAEFKEKLASFVESVLLEESLQKYSDTLQQWKAALPVREEATEHKQDEVDQEFEEEMARSVVEVEELPPEVPVEVENSSVEEKLQESQKHFESTLETQKDAFLTALDKQLKTKRESVATTTGLDTPEIQALEILYASKVSDDIAQTAAKKWWDFPVIQAASDFISTKIAGIPPYHARVAHLQQQLISAKSAHDLGKALENPVKTYFAASVTVELEIGEFTVDSAAKKLFSTLEILDQVQSGIAALKQLQPEPAPTKKRGLAGVVDRVAKGPKIEESQDKPRPK